MSSARLGHIIGRIYEAAEDPKVWLDVLRLLGKTLRSTNNVFVLNDAASLGGAISLSEGTDPKFDRDYNSYYHSVNTILDGLQGRFSPGKILASTDACGDDDLVKTEYYQDFLRPHDLFYFIGGTISQTATSNSLISLGRSHKLGPWTAVEKQTIQFLMPHFQRAAQLAGKFAIIQQERDYLLNRLIMGVIILNERGTVEFLNGAAELLLKKKDGLYWGANGICAVDHAESARLHYMISTAKSNASPKAGAAGGSLSIRRSSLRRPLLVSVAPIIRTDASRLSESSRVAMFALNKLSPVHNDVWSDASRIKGCRSNYSRERASQKPRTGLVSLCRPPECT